MRTPRPEIGERRRVPRLVIGGGIARVTKVGPRWVEYAFDQPGHTGKMRRESWNELKRVRGNGAAK